jgi:hypothetical protein
METTLVCVSALEKVYKYWSTKLKPNACSKTVSKISDFDMKMVLEDTVYKDVNCMHML